MVTSAQQTVVCDDEDGPTPATEAAETMAVAAAGVEVVVACSHFNGGWRRR